MIEPLKAECYELNTWNRKTLEKMLKPRAGINPIIFNNSIYVFGGFLGIESSEDFEVINDCER